MRFIYSLFFYFALPLVMARMAYRSLRLPAYGYRWNERLAWYFRIHARESTPLLWFHAVSVGEAESSGCFRMRNTDVADLYKRVSVGTTVVVK